MIGEDFRPVLAAALLGPERSALIPGALKLGWLDQAGAVLGFSPVRVDADVFDQTAVGVVNSSLLDGGVAGAGWVVHGAGLFTLDDQLIFAATFSPPLTPAEGDPLVFTPGTFEVVVS